MIEKWRVQLKEKVWIIPATYSLLAVILAAVVATVDFYLDFEVEQMLPPILYTEVDLAQTILSSLTTALLTMTTFTFSTIMVVLTTYASQYSPRTIKNFITDDLTLRVLGIFMGGFIYSTLSMVFMRESISEDPVIAGVIGVIIAIICLIFFAIFIHHVASDMQASRLIERLSMDADSVVDYYFNLQKEERISLYHDGDWIAPSSSFQVLSGHHGYIQFIDHLRLGEFAKKHEIMIDINLPIGEYVHKNTPIMTIYVEANRIPDVKDVEVKEFFLIGKERDVKQDPLFAVQKMIEVALRAISPGINDPNTANDSIRQTGRILGNLTQFPVRPWMYVDEEKKPYTRFSIQSYEEIIYKTFYQVRHYGKEDISVIFAMVDALKYAAETAPKEHKEKIMDMLDYLLEKVDVSSLPKLDQEWLQLKIEEFNKVVN